MDTRPSEPVRFATLVALIAGIAAWPVAIVWFLRQTIGTIVPGWFIQTICYGFLCSATVAVTGFVVALPVLWVAATLYDRGYLPEAW